MRLPSDILGLIYVYAYLPKPVRWIDPARLLDITHSNVLTNPAGVYWIETMLDVFYKSSNLPVSENELIEYLAQNKSIKGINLMEKLILEHKLLNKQWKPSLFAHLAANPYGYHYKTPESKIYDKLLLSIKNFPIPDLISRYSNYITDDENILKLLASNPFTFRIFLKQIETQGINPIQYKTSICSNTSEEALGYIGQNFDNYYKTPKLFANPNAHKLITRALSILGDQPMNTKKQQIYALALCSNTNPEILKILYSYPELINIKLASNPADMAVDILLRNPELFTHPNFPVYLVKNTNPRIIPLIKSHITHINFRSLSTNPLVFHHVPFSHKFTDRVSNLLIKKYTQSYNILIQMIGRTPDYFI